MSKFFSHFRTFYLNTFKQYQKLLIIKIINLKIYSFKKFINYNNASQFAIYSAVFLRPKIVRNKPPTTESENVQNNTQVVIAMAESALANGYIQDAETMFMVALQLAEINKLESSINYIYDRLIDISYIMGDYNNAQDLIYKIIERLKNNGTHFDDDVVITYRLKLARLYSFMSKIDEADKTFKECIRIQKRKLEKGDIKEKTGMIMVDSYFWYGVFLYQQKRYEDALRNIEAAHKCSNNVKQIVPSQELVILTVLAETNSVLGNYDKAIINLNAAIEIGKNINHPELAFCYVMLGQVYIKKQMYNEAQRWCEQGQTLGRQQKNIPAQQASEACLKKIKETFDDKYQKDQQQA